MKGKLKYLWLLLLWPSLTLGGAFDKFENWKYGAKIEIKSPGLIKFQLPYEIIGRSHDDLRDLRFLTEDGQERPFATLIKRNEDSVFLQSVRNAGFQAKDGQTIITLPTESESKIDQIILQSPAVKFLKTVHVESLVGNSQYGPIAQNQVIFRESPGVENLAITIPLKNYTGLRVRVEDTPIDRVPFTGALVRIQKKAAASVDIMETKYSIINNTNTDTTLVKIQLPAKHLAVSKLIISATDHVFQRRTALESNSRNMTSMIFNVSLAESNNFSRTDIPVEDKVPADTLELKIFNGNNPPLNITSVKAVIYPTHFLAYSEKAATGYLITGNSSADKPEYEISTLIQNLKNAAESEVEVFPLLENPAYKPLEFLPELNDRKSKIDVTSWKYRKQINIKTPGVQLLELDPEIISVMGHWGEDLRIVRDDWQIPYVFEQLLDLKDIDLKVERLERAPPGIEQKHSVWKVTLPHKNNKLTAIAFEIADSFFERDAALYIENTNSQNQAPLELVALSHWKKGTENEETIFTINLNIENLPSSIYLAVRDGDNPPLSITSASGAYQPAQLIFKSNDTAPLWLYYGNHVKRPEYDIAVLTGKLKKAEKETAALGEQEELQALHWWKLPLPSGFSGVIFWMVLGLVVVLLLIVIAKLLPETE